MCARARNHCQASVQAQIGGVICAVQAVPTRVRVR